MFESGRASRADLEGLLSALSGLERAVDDAERVHQLDLLERVKSACAAAQARVTVDLADSQQEIAAQWREHARAVADAGDFESWRRARAMAERPPVRRRTTRRPQPLPLAAGAGAERTSEWLHRSRWRGGSRRTPGAASYDWRMR